MPLPPCRGRDKNAEGARPKILGSAAWRRGHNMGANYEVRGDVAVISLDNPPVNGLGYDTRLGIVNGLERALDDAAVKAIVVTGAGKAFSGGADIREFGSPKAIA